MLTRESFEKSLFAHAINYGESHGQKLSAVVDASPFLAQDIISLLDRPVDLELMKPRLTQ